MDKVNLKFIWNCKKVKTNQDNLAQSWKCILPDIKTFYKTTVMNTVSYWERRDKQTHEIGLSVETDSHVQIYQK